MNPQVAKSPAHGWLGIPSAVASTAANLRFFLAGRPSTPLRVLSLIAIDAVLRSRGIAMDPQQRLDLIEAMELGALLNDRFDGDPCDRAEIRKCVSWFAKSPARGLVWKYAKRLRKLELTRPASGSSAVVVREYRENVNKLSLAVLWALAGSRSLASAELEIDRDEDLQILFRIVMLTQVIDDVLDSNHDRSLGLPTFTTAANVDSQSLRALVSTYVEPSRWRTDARFCLRLALWLSGIVARVAIRICPA